MEQQEKKGFFRGLMDKISGAMGGTPEPEPQPQVEQITETTAEAKATPAPPEAPEQAVVEAAAEPVPAPVAAPPAAQAPTQAKPSFFERLKQGLQKTKDGLVGRIDALVLGKKEIDADTMEELEEILITSDVGVKTTVELVRSLEQRLGRSELKDGAALRTALKDEIFQRLNTHHAPLHVSGQHPFVLLVIGVNGVGKTTTIGKLASRFTAEGKKVLLAAADTFRAAASEQLLAWGERSGVDVIRHKEGADPSAVVFDACKAAIARDVDILIVDTAGRLHTKVNLMEEMKKIRRVISREIPGAPHETLLVVDAATGQNAVSQARLFKETAGVTGIALTKLDGTAKGGIVVAVSHEFALPVRYIGVGEAIEDLRDFDPREFTDALFQA